MWGENLQMTQAGQIRPVVGQEIGFDDVPRLLVAIEHRNTMGKPVVRAPAPSA